MDMPTNLNEEKRAADAGQWQTRGLAGRVVDGGTALQGLDSCRSWESDWRAPQTAARSRLLLLRKRRRVPHLQRLVLAPRDDAVAVGAERHAPDHARVPLKSEDLLSGPGIPHLQGAVLAPRDDPPAVRAVGHAQDTFRVSLERESFLSGPGVPHLHRLVSAP